MRVPKLIILLCFGIPALTVHAEAADEMVHIVFRYVAPDIQPSSYEAKPLEVWRVGFQYMRLQEAPDPKMGIHGLIISNAPNTWMINLYDKAGQLFVDPGPSTDIHFQLFPGSRIEDLNRLEFGHEVEFFRAHDAEIAEPRSIDGEEVEGWILQYGDVAVTMHVRSDGHPYQVGIEGEEGAFAIRYEVYEVDLEPDWPLFEPAKDIMINIEDQ